jgi:hypothetical protein
LAVAFAKEDSHSFGHLGEEHHNRISRFRTFIFKFQVM